jgi:hypothetical protein
MKSRMRWVSSIVSVMCALNWSICLSDDAALQCSSATRKAKQASCANTAGEIVCACVCVCVCVCAPRKPWEMCLRIDNRGECVAVVVEVEVVVLGLCLLWGVDVGFVM